MMLLGDLNIMLIKFTKMNQIKVVEKLLSLGADVHCRCNRALAEAIVGEYKEIENLLLEHGADIDQAKRIVAMSRQPFNLSMYLRMNRPIIRNFFDY